MARPAHAAVRIIQNAPQLLGRDAGYRRFGYLFVVPVDALDIAKQNVTMQRELASDRHDNDRPEGARCPHAWFNTDGGTRWAIGR